MSAEAQMFLILITIFSNSHLTPPLPLTPTYLKIFRVGGGRKLEGAKESSFLAGWKLKGPKFFQNPSITLNKNEKGYRRWPKIKGAELGEGGRKLEGPKIKGAEN